MATETNGNTIEQLDLKQVKHVNNNRAQKFKVRFRHLNWIALASTPKIKLWLNFVGESKACRELRKRRTASSIARHRHVFLGIYGRIGFGLIHMGDSGKNTTRKWFHSTHTHAPEFPYQFYLWGLVQSTAPGWKAEAGVEKGDVGGSRACSHTAVTTTPD